MTRSVKDLRELICVSRLTARESDDEQEFLSDEEQQIIRAFSRLSYTGDYRPESVICARPPSSDSHSPDSGISTNGQSPDGGINASQQDGVKGSIKPIPPSGTKRSGAFRRKKKARKQQHKVLDTLPEKHKLPQMVPLPPVAVSRLKPTTHLSGSSSDDEQQYSLALISPCTDLRKISPSAATSLIKQHRTNFDDLLTYMDATIIAEWLDYCNEQVSELSQWIHTGDNFIQFAHFWLSDFQDSQRTEIFRLEYSIIVDHLNLVFAAGCEAGNVSPQLLLQYLEALFWEYPSKMLSSKGPHLFLNYLDILTSERQTYYKTLLSDIKCSTRVKQYAQWTLAIRAFTLVSMWLAILNFYRRLLKDSSKEAPVLRTTIDREDPNVDRMYHAIRLGHIDVVHYLLASGKVKARGLDDHGRTLIFTAVMHNQPDIVKFLLKKVSPRPDCNLPAATGNSPLHAAANNGDVALVASLLRVDDVHVNQRNTLCENATPLHLAVMHGHLHVVEVLLVAGADCCAKMGDLSASDIARDFGHDDIFEMLENYNTLQKEQED